MKESKYLRDKYEVNMKKIRLPISLVLLGLLCLSSCDSCNKKNAFLVNRRTATPERVKEVQRARAVEAEAKQRLPPLIPEEKWTTIKSYFSTAPKPKPQPPFIPEEEWTTIKLFINTNTEKCYYAIGNSDDKYELISPAYSLSRWRLPLDVVKALPNGSLHISVCKQRIKGGSRIRCIVYKKISNFRQDIKHFLEFKEDASDNIFVKWIVDEGRTRQAQVA
ncbi:hypothetical protein AGMMS49936_10730 [Endomicrobiia bacterium]|nr:hypothetical protein AGMMS49936_10730 [Endomicrobiia bacterium]